MEAVFPIEALQTRAIELRKDFPILNSVKPYGKDLIYFDNAATSQKPQVVIDRIVKYYSTENSNIHRGVHFLSQIASEHYEQAREYIANFLNAYSSKEIIFTRGATESINLVANSLGKLLKEGDEVIISGLEHHANIVPWQILKDEKNIVLKVIPLNEDGSINIDSFHKLLSNKTKLVSIAYVSNGIGIINNVEAIISASKNIGALVMLDACQSAPHFKMDVQKLNIDFLAFSGHKTFAPTGIGVLWGKEKNLEQMPPYQAGGDMIKSVTMDKTIYNELPYKFEAGTPHIEGVIGLETALRYCTETAQWDFITNYEHYLTQYFLTQATNFEGFKLLGSKDNKVPVFTFQIEGVHPLDLGTMLDFQGIAIRTGNHCTQPLIKHFGYDSSARASLSFYNTTNEIDSFFILLDKVVTKLKK